MYSQSIVGALPPAIARAFLPVASLLRLSYLLSNLCLRETLSFRPVCLSLSTNAASAHTFPTIYKFALDDIRFSARSIASRDVASDRVATTTDSLVRIAVRRHPVLRRYHHNDTSARFNLAGMYGGGDEGQVRVRAGAGVSESLRVP